MKKLRKRRTKAEKIALGKTFYEEQQRRKIDNSFVQWSNEQEVGQRNVYLYIKEYLQSQEPTTNEVKKPTQQDKRRITIYIDRDLYRKVGYKSIWFDASISETIERLLRRVLDNDELHEIVENLM